MKTYRNQGKKSVSIDLDPKAVTNDELFGVINPSTREWKDGNIYLLLLTIYWFENIVLQRHL